MLALGAKQRAQHISNNFLSIVQEVENAADLLAIAINWQRGALFEDRD
jgi:hypothetical protein